MYMPINEHAIFNYYYIPVLINVNISIMKYQHERKYTHLTFSWLSNIELSVSMNTQNTAKIL